MVLSIVVRRASLLIHHMQMVVVMYHFPPGDAPLHRNVIHQDQLTALPGEAVRFNVN